MKELELTFIGRGEVRHFAFEQVAKSDTAYIYKVTPPNSKHHYEVFARKVNERFNTITYPSSPAFGRYAFTWSDFDKALAVFNTL
jgi:hypothetical protein